MTDNSDASVGASAYVRTALERKYQELERVAFKRQRELVLWEGTAGYDAAMEEYDAKRALLSGQMQALATTLRLFFPGWEPTLARRHRTKAPNTSMKWGRATGLVLDVLRDAERPLPQLDIIEAAAKGLRNQLESRDDQRKFAATIRTSIHSLEARGALVAEGEPKVYSIPPMAKGM
jgi:hypothetical protein